MRSKIDPVRKRVGPLLDKTLVNAVAHRIAKEFPRMGGDRISRLCAEMVLEVVDGHLRPRQHVRHGQTVWMAFCLDDPPSRGKRTAQTRMTPVLLDLVVPEDIEAYIERVPSPKRLLTKARRLCQQAYEQDALLSNCDLAALLNRDDATIASLLTDYERRTGKVVPRRATLHDMGSGLTHKRIICLKRYRDGKEPDQIARETHHDIQSVDRYLSQYDRVRHCRLQGLSPIETAYMLSCSLSLVNEYILIDKALEDKND